MLTILINYNKGKKLKSRSIIYESIIVRHMMTAEKPNIKDEEQKSSESDNEEELTNAEEVKRLTDDDVPIHKVKEKPLNPESSDNNNAYMRKEYAKKHKIQEEIVEDPLPEESEIEVKESNTWEDRYKAIKTRILTPKEEKKVDTFAETVKEIETMVSKVASKEELARYKSKVRLENKNNEFIEPNRKEPILSPGIIIGNPYNKAIESVDTGLKVVVINGINAAETVA